jgi:hypothetical protein
MRGGTSPPLKTGLTSYRIYGERPTVKSSIRALMLVSKTGGVSARRARWPCGAPAVGPPTGPATNGRRSRAGVAQSTGHAVVSPGVVAASTETHGTVHRALTSRVAGSRDIGTDMRAMACRARATWTPPELDRLDAARPVARAPCLAAPRWQEVQPHPRCPDATSAEKVSRSGFITYRLPSTTPRPTDRMMDCAVHLLVYPSDHAVPSLGFDERKHHAGHQRLRGAWQHGA